jgi:hypothetical protein
MRRGFDAGPQAVDLFTPISIAIDGDIPPVFAGRSIGIPLEPLKCDEAAGPLTPEAIDNLSEMGRMAARWAIDTANDPPPDAAALAECRDPNWLPLFSIAASIGDECKTRVIEAMKRVPSLSGTAELERLLSDIRTVMRDIRDRRRLFLGPNKKPIGDHDRIRSADLLKDLHSHEDGRWREYGRNGQPITPHALAQILSDAKIRPGMLTFHTSDENGPGESFQDRGYLFTQFDQAIERHSAIAVPEAD